MFKNFMIQIGRVGHELALSGMLLFMYASGSYLYLNTTLQTIALKATLVSLGFLHAHVTTKLSFPKIDWSKDETDHFEKILRIALYCTFIYCWANGG